jgi:hypothetical protein
MKGLDRVTQDLAAARSRLGKLYSRGRLGETPTIAPTKIGCLVDAALTAIDSAVHAVDQLKMHEVGRPDRPTEIMILEGETDDDPVTAGGCS